MLHREHSRVASVCACCVSGRQFSPFALAVLVEITPLMGALFMYLFEKFRV